jgi:hypothetical protein
MIAAVAAGMVAVRTGLGAGMAVRPGTGQGMAVALGKAM